MAISLKDAWNDYPSFEDQMYSKENNNENFVSAKQSELNSSSQTSKKNHETSEQLKTLQNMNLISQMILQEMQQMKKDEARRCVIYIVIAVLIFGIFCVYIDKLQARIKVLNYNVRRLQMNEDYRYNLRPTFPQSFQEYQ